MRYLLLILLCFGGIAANPQESKKISRLLSGYVKDKEGHPVPKTKVCAEPHSAWSGPIPCGLANADGEFSLNIWRSGTYTISAENKAAGYPNAYYGFYGNFFGDLPVVTVDESSNLNPVEVRVGPKAGRVILKIVDEESGRLVESGAVDVCRTDKPKMCSSTSIAFPNGVYEFLAPEIPFTLKLKVWGSNNEWEERYAVDENNEQVKLLQVALGERKEINIRLKR